MHLRLVVWDMVGPDNMGGSESKTVDAVALTGGGAAARAAAFTAPPAVSERVVGLDNCGNTCYCNAVLQALYFCVPLRIRLERLHAVIKGDVAPEALAKADVEWLAEEPRDDSEDDDDGDPASPSSPNVASPVIPNEPDSSFGTSSAGAPNTSLTSTSAGVPAPPGNSNAPKPWTLKDHQDTVLSKMCELFEQLTSQAQSNKVKHMNPKVAVGKVKKENIMFNNNLQQDAHEFAIFVLNTLIEDERGLLRYTDPKTESPLQRMLRGTTVSRTFCGECDTETSVDQPFLDINVDVYQNSSLRHCTELFSAIETLSGEDKFRCDACTSPVDARRRVLFKHLPDILFIQLKRFNYNERVGGFMKRNDRVAFAPTMMITTVRNEARRYGLAGVVVHHGATPHLGHYVALCQSHRSHRWYKCDDDIVSAFSERDLQRYFGVSESLHEANMPSTATAYLLFYTRLD
jgi:ubiquitin C-terminal hydrolase